jgi:alkanesulfonate monooxygenase SsuD/methylene tetrahydromethanopterin reductase-like flavin-dependent oxidoreductase (luciferase family)
MGEARLGGQSPDTPPRPVGKYSPGWGGYPIVGSPGQVVEELMGISNAGVDGCVLSWVNWEQEMRYWGDAVMPLLEQAGLRKPFQPH